MTETTSSESTFVPEAAPEAPQPGAVAAGTGVEEILAVLQALDQNPDLLPELEMVIREQLRKGITFTTLAAVYTGLAFYIEDDAVASLLTILTRGSEPAVIEQVKAQASPPTWRWLRRLLALYGSDLQEAHVVSGEEPESWRELDRHAYYSAVSGRWKVMLDITKYSGMQLHLEESPQSVVNLARGIVDILNSIPPEATTDLIPADSLQRFADVVRQFFALYAPGMLEQPPSEAQGGLEDVLKCPHCGQENRTGARFCGKCGQPLTPAP